MSCTSKSERMRQFERACRERGLARTTQRRTLLEMILDREDHPTADQVYEQARTRIRGISRTTVYRILDTFVELGLVAKICHPGPAARFDPKIHRHHHLVCLNCEGIIDLEDKRLNDIAWPDVRGLGFEIRDHHVHFRGVCSACRRKLGETSGSGRKAAAGGTATRSRARSRCSGRLRRTRS